MSNLALKVLTVVALLATTTSALSQKQLTSSLHEAEKSYSNVQFLFAFTSDVTFNLYSSFFLNTVEIRAFNNASDASSKGKFTSTIVDSTITDGTIAVNGYFPAHSSLRFAKVTAILRTAPTLFNFTRLYLSSTTIYISEVTAQWEANTGNFMTLSDNFTVPASSGFFLSAMNVDKAKHVVEVTTSKFCKDSDGACFGATGGVFSIDNVTCNSCLGSFMKLDTISTLYTANNGIVRFLNIQHDAGTQSFMEHTSGLYAYRFKGPSTLIFKNIKTSSKFFEMGNVVSTGENTQPRVTFDTITATDMGLGILSNPLFNSVPNIITYGRAITIGNTAIDLKNNKLKIPITTVVDRNGKVSSTEVSGPVVNTVADIGCPSGTLAAVSGGCACASGTSGPNCLPLADPSDPAALSTQCTAAQCDECVPTLSSVCMTCKTGYKLGKTGNCVEKTCLVAFCDECVPGQENRCQKCQKGDVLGNYQCEMIEGEKSKLSTGAIVGIAVACGAVVILSILLIIFFCCRNKAKPMFIVYQADYDDTELDESLDVRHWLDTNKEEAFGTVTILREKQETRLTSTKSTLSRAERVQSRRSFRNTNYEDDDDDTSSYSSDGSEY